MIINDPTLLNKIAEWRRKSADGTITVDELREAMKVLRQNRMSTADAAAASKKSGGKKKSPAAPIDAADLLSQL